MSPRVCVSGTNIIVNNIDRKDHMILSYDPSYLTFNVIPFNCEALSNYNMDLALYKINNIICVCLQQAGA